MAYGKRITLFLVDGSPAGRWTCELSNWTGKAYKIPRTMLRDCSDRNDLKQAGVYFLFGRDDETDDPRVYIGEAENIFIRLNQHLTGKDFWNEAIVLISKDGYLNKAHVKYLESRFHEIADAAKRYKIENGNNPTKSSISEPEQAELEEFIEHARVLVGTLGHNVFEPVALAKSNSDSNMHFFFKQKKGGICAEGIQTSDGFVVFAGATTEITNDNETIKPWILRLRKKHTEEGSFVDGKTTEDILFSSPSSAAGFFTGYNMSGPSVWKTIDGKSLKEIEDGN